MDERDIFAYRFIHQGKQQGWNNDEIHQGLVKALADYDEQRRNELLQRDNRTLVQKGVDLASKWGGSAAKLGGAYGDSVAALVSSSDDIVGDLAHQNPIVWAANKVTGGKYNQGINNAIRQATGVRSQNELQQRQLAQDQIIMDRVARARQAGDEQEAQRLLGLLNNPQYQDQTDYDAQERAYKRGIQDAIQGGVGTAAEFASTGIPKAGSLGQAALQGAISGGIQGAAMSDADLFNEGQYGQLAQDALMGAGTGAVLGAASYGIDKGWQKGKEKLSEFGENRAARQQGSRFAPQSIEEYEKQVAEQAAQNAANMSDDVAKQTAKAAENLDGQAGKTVGGNVAKTVNDQPLNYRSLSDKQRIRADREISEFYLKNDISTPRQVGKAYDPRNTFLEVSEQLKDQGLKLSDLSADEIVDLSEAITGDQGATTKITREIIANTERPLPKTIEINGKRVDSVMQAVDESFKKSSKLRTNSKAKREIKDLIQATLDEASHDLNTYDVPKLYDALKEIEGYAAEADQIANRSIMPNLIDKQTAKAYRAAADELSNYINRASVDQGVFAQGRDRLAEYYRGIGMNRLASQVASAKNLGQLRTTAKPWVRANLLINEGQASMFSTFNKNTNVANRLLSGVSRIIPGGNYVQGAVQFADAATGGQLGRNISYAVEDAVSAVR